MSSPLYLCISRCDREIKDFVVITNYYFFGRMTKEKRKKTINMG